MPDSGKSSKSRDTVGSVVLTLIVGLMIATISFAEDKSDAVIIWAIILGILLVIGIVIYWVVRLIRGTVRAVTGDDEEPALPTPVAAGPATNEAPVEKARSDSVYCTNCGALAGPGANFCAYCGAPLTPR